MNGERNFHIVKFTSGVIRIAPDVVVSTKHYNTDNITIEVLSINVSLFPNKSGSIKVSYWKMISAL